MSDDMLVDRSAADDLPPRDAGDRWWRRAGPWLVALGLLAGWAGLVVAYYYASLGNAPFTSDGAGNVLQAQAIVEGNPLLRGWWTSDVSFYTTELPEYALVTAIRGVAPNVVHLCGAITYALTVLLTALVARGGERGAVGYWRAGVAVAITIALCVTGSIGLYLTNPNHAGTAVPVLLLLLVLDRAERRLRHRWLLPVAACVILAVADTGDQLVLAVAIVPLAVVCVVRLVGGRRSGGERRAQAWLDWALLAAAVVAAGLASLAGHVIRALGGFDLQPINGVAVAPLGRILGNASTLWSGLLTLFGANQPGTPRQPQPLTTHLLVLAMADLHMVGLLVALAGLAAGIAAFGARPADRVTQILVASILVLLAFGVLTTLVHSRSYVHEVAVLMPLGAALAGRVLAPLAAQAASHRPWARTAAATALAAWLAVGVAEVCYTATWPAKPPPQQAVAAWLVSQHLRDGLSGYWQATSTTVTSDGQVLVAGITLPGASTAGESASSRPAAYRWESSADWYQPASHDATFVIAVTGPSAVTGGGLSVAQARAAFGAPVTTHQIGNELIMLYHYNLLTRLGTTTFPGTN